MTSFYRSWRSRPGGTTTSAGPALGGRSARFGHPGRQAVRITVWAVVVMAGGWFAVARGSISMACRGLVDEV